MRKKQDRIDRRKVRAWMIMQSIRAIDIQRELGYKRHSVVTDTLSGARDNKRVLAWLIDNGCPIEYLKIPTERQGAA